MRDLPGVGSNLQDHLDIPVSVANPTREALGLSPQALPWLMTTPFEWLANGTGPLSTNGVNAGGYCRSDALDGNRGGGGAGRGKCQLLPPAPPYYPFLRGTICTMRSMWCLVLQGNIRTMG